jgi:putative ABC transport system permease protein
MFAYGLPVRTVLRHAVAESLIIGLIATVLGIGLGLGILSWVVNSSLEEILPDLGVIVSLSGPSIFLAAVAGAGAMALAPLLTVRKLRRMDIPSTLRVLE